MHIHGNSMNAILDLSAAYAAQQAQAQAKSEAEATRKKLFESIMHETAENEYSVVALAKRQESSKEQPDHEHEQDETKDREQYPRSHISDWA